MWGTGNLTNGIGSTWPPTAPPGNRISADDAKNVPGRAQDEGPAMGNWAGGQGWGRDVLPTLWEQEE